MMESALNDVATLNDVFLGLIARTKFNRFDGARIAGDLRRHPALWDAVLFSRPDAGITLRDIPSGHYNADRVMLLTTAEPKVRWMDLVSIVRGWETDSITVYLPQRRVLKAGRYDGDDGGDDNYRLRNLRKPAETLGNVLASSRSNETRAVIDLWWD